MLEFGGSLILKFFKYPELMGITKIKYPTDTGMNIRHLLTS
jgi:hypothetical protein